MRIWFSCSLCPESARPFCWVSGNTWRSKVRIFQHRAVEQTINNNNIIEKCSFYLDESEEHCSAYIFLLSRVGFVSRSVLHLLHRKLCENRVEDKQTCVRILYEQMYFSQEEMEELERSDEECGAYVRMISENDDWFFISYLILLLWHLLRNRRSRNISKNYWAGLMLKLTRWRII